MKFFDHLVVGAGPAGCTIARTLLDAGRSVLIIDKKHYVGGSTADIYNEDVNCYVQIHGPHIFHTNSDEVVEFLSQYTSWRLYNHEVSARIGKIHVPLPINYLTIAMIKGQENFPTSVVEDQHVFEINEWMKIYENPANAYEQSLIRFGKAVTDSIFAPYSKKQWGTELQNLDPSLIARIPFLSSWNENEDYFQKSFFQAQPREGYTKLFERMIEGATVLLGVENHEDILSEYTFNREKFWTGPIDKLVNERPLIWRCSQFKFEKSQDHLITAVVNTPSLNDDTIRLTDMAKTAGRPHNNRRSHTIIAHETVSGIGEPTYPMPSRVERLKAAQYKHLIAKDLRDWRVAGRLGAYQYFDMDQAVAHGRRTAIDVLRQ